MNIHNPERVKYERPRTPGELLDLALKELAAADEKNFRQQIGAATAYIMEAKEWMNRQLLFSEESGGQE